MKRRLMYLVGFVRLTVCHYSYLPCLTTLWYSTSLHLATFSIPCLYGKHTHCWPDLLFRTMLNAILSPCGYCSCISVLILSSTLYNLTLPREYSSIILQCLCLGRQYVFYYLNISSMNSASEKFTTNKETHCIILCCRQTKCTHVDV